MVAINDVAVVSILTLFHVVAIIYTWKVGKTFNSKSWLLIIFAFVLLLLKRLVSFLSIFEVISYTGSIVTLNENILPLIAWGLIGLGMIRIHYNIKTSISLERKLRRKGKKS